MRHHADQVRDRTKPCGGHSLTEWVEAIGSKASYYSSRATVGSDDVADLMSREKSKTQRPTGLPKAIQEQVMTKANPFWVIDECQNNSFNSSYEEKTLYGRTDELTEEAYFADRKPWNSPQQTVDVGHSSVDVTLTTETIENPNPGRIDCGLID